jgi:hypothetical protein
MTTGPMLVELLSNRLLPAMNWFQGTFQGAPECVV